MTLQEILDVKGHVVYTILADAPLTTAIRKLVEHNVGSLLVCRRGGDGEEHLAGIITERDLLHFCAEHLPAFSDVLVSEVMSSAVITGLLEDSVEEVMGLMTRKRIRHLPVLDKGRLAGMVSIGDIVKTQHDRLAMENRFMKDYIRG